MSPTGALRGTSEGQYLKLDFLSILAPPADPSRPPFAPQSDVDGHLWAGMCQKPENGAPAVARAYVTNLEGSRPPPGAPVEGVLAILAALCFHTLF